jgi:hypothetical protein
VSGATSWRAEGAEPPRSVERRVALEQVADDGGDSTDIRRSRSTASLLLAAMVWVNMLTLAAGGDVTNDGGAVGAAAAAGGDG